MPSLPNKKNTVFIWPSTWKVTAVNLPIQMNWLKFVPTAMIHDRIIKNWKKHTKAFPISYFQFKIQLFTFILWRNVFSPLKMCWIHIALLSFLWAKNQLWAPLEVEMWLGRVQCELKDRRSQENTFSGENEHTAQERERNIHKWDTIITKPCLAQKNEQIIYEKYC